MPDKMHPYNIKSTEDLKLMIEGGKKLRSVKEALMDTVEVGVSAMDIEDAAVSLIAKTGGVPSFKMVPGYSWATCVNINEGIVHGIPKKSIVFKSGDVVSVDVGLYYKGFHTDTSFTKALDPTDKIKDFVSVGKKALEEAVDRARVGNRVYDISEAIESVVEGGGYTPLRALVGHGVGRELHEEPKIPCYTAEAPKYTPAIVDGMTLAIEVMYAMGTPAIKLDNDGWTISMRDGKISALFEETVIVTTNGPKIIT